jgi:RimJ/RimL family protein N-acetyltransferase
VTDDAPFDRVTWPRATERLSVRPLETGDLPVVFGYRSDPDVARWLPSHPTSYEGWLLTLDKVGVLSRTLVVERDGAIVGDLYLHVSDAWAQAEAPEGAARAVQAEIGWVFAPEHQGHGYATEAVQELVRICFDDLGLRRLTAVAFAGNPASMRVMDKVGMRQEAGHRQESLHRDLGWVDSVVHALLADEWRVSR